MVNSDDAPEPPPSPLFTASHTVQAYSGTTIKQLGVVTLSCKHKDTEWHSSDITAILGLPSSRQLRLWQYTACFRWQRHQLPCQSTTPWTLSIYIQTDSEVSGTSKENFTSLSRRTPNQWYSPLENTPSSSWRKSEQSWRKWRTLELSPPSQSLQTGSTHLPSAERPAVVYKSVSTQDHWTSASRGRTTRPPQWRRSPIASAAPRCSASWMRSMATGQSSSTKSYRSSRPSTAPSDASGSRGFPSDWMSHRMHSSSAWIRSSVSAQAPLGSPTTSSSMARMTNTMTEISTTSWRLPRNG